MTRWDDHYNALYSIDGKAATLTLVGFSDAISVTAIPKIAGASMDIAFSGSRDAAAAFGIETIRPAADVRMSELTDNDVEREDLKGGTITVAGDTWRIETTLPRPSPEGEANGELRLFLIEN